MESKKNLEERQKRTEDRGEERKCSKAAEPVRKRPQGGPEQSRNSPIQKTSSNQGW